MRTDSVDLAEGSPASPSPTDRAAGALARHDELRGLALRVSRGVLVGGAVAAAIVAARQFGLLDGVAALLVAALVLLAVPTSRQLSRRILLTGAISFGWLPALWWWDLPVGSVGRVSLLMAVTAGALGGWVASRVHPLDGLRRLLPHVAWVDALPVGALVLAVAMFKPWLRVTSGASALSMLMLGWDHSGHFDMAEMIRVHGVVVAGVAVPAGSDPWTYTHYPQGYHAAAAAVMELMGSPVVGTPAQEVVLYAHAMAVVSAVAVVLVVAGIAALPVLRRRPLAAVLAVGMVISAFFWGPGSSILFDGFPNFFLACALVAAVPLIVTPIARWWEPVQLAALAGALVGVAHSWALLLTVAAPMALVVILPLRRGRARSSWVKRAVGVAIALAAAASTVVAILVISVQPLADVVSVGGGVTSRGVTELCWVVLATCTVTLFLALQAQRHWPDDVVRAVAVIVGPLTGVAVAFWIARVQLSQGELGYYFWKYAIALEVLALVVASAAGAILVARSPALGGSVPRVLGLGSLLVVALVLAFGVPLPALSDRLGVADSTGMDSYFRLGVVAMSPWPDSERLLAAAAVSRDQPNRSIYLPIGSGDRANPASIGQWYEALSGEWTEDLNAPIRLLRTGDRSPAGGSGLARLVLESDPELDVVVAPEYAAAIRAGVGAGLQERVHTW